MSFHIAISNPDVGKSPDQPIFLLIDLAAGDGEDRLARHLDQVFQQENYGEAIFITGQINDMMMQFGYVDSSLEGIYETVSGFQDYLLDEMDAWIKQTVTTLVYQSKRQGFDSKDCAHLRYGLGRVLPAFDDYTEKDFEKYISKAEEEDGDFYGGYLSEDSDDEFALDDDEQVPQPTYRFKEGGVFPAFDDVRGNLTSISYSLDMDDALWPEARWGRDITENADIHYPKDLDLEQVTADLKIVNAAIQAGKVDVDHLTKTRFCIAQYRGISYNLLSFGAASRRSNREKVELHRPVYSSAVFDLAGISPGEYYAGKTDDKVEEQLAQRAMELQDVLIAKRAPKPVTFKKKRFECPAFALQDFYSKSYDAFHQELEKYLKEEADRDEDEVVVSDDRAAIFGGLGSAKNPFVSTGNTPRHALRYAYGIKYYEGHKDERLRPRWRSSGRAERPYSGKVYVSLHPVADYLVASPLDVVVLNRSGKTSVNALIAAERECTFPAFIPSCRVVFEHIARYPGFQHEDYKDIFRHKYGMYRGEYMAWKKLFAESRPHSAERKKAKLALGNWLCHYYEARLVETARRLAAENGMVLVYRNSDGLLTLKLPKQVTPAKLSGARSSGVSSSDMQSGNALDQPSSKGLELKKKGDAPKMGSAKPLGLEAILESQRRAAAFRQWIAARFTRNEVPGDGNCLFHAVGRAVHPIFNPPQAMVPVDCSHIVMRAHAVAEARRQRDALIISDATLGLGYFDTMSQVATSALQVARWGSDREIGFLAQALRVNIRIYRHDSPNGFTETGPQGHAAVGNIYLQHVNGNHWIWLTPNNGGVLADNFAP